MLFARTEVLIDEGRTPLVVSAQAEVPSEKYTTALQIAATLERDVDYTVLEKALWPRESVQTCQKQQCRVAESRGGLFTL